MRQLIGIARRFSPVLVLMTAAALLMLQPPVHAADEMAMPPSLSAVSADGDAAGASHGRRPMTPDMPGTGEHQGRDGEIAHRVATAPAASMTNHETPPSSKADRGQISNCVGCASPGSLSPSPMDCVAAGCLVLMVLLVGSAAFVRHPEVGVGRWQRRESAPDWQRSSCVAGRARRGHWPSCPSAGPDEPSAAPLADADGGTGRRTPQAIFPTGTDAGRTRRSPGRLESASRWSPGRRRRVRHLDARAPIP